MAPPLRSRWRSHSTPGTGSVGASARLVVYPRAIGAGTVTALLTFGLGAIVAVLAGRSVAVFNGFVVVGCLLGGFRAGLGYPPAPLANGAGAGAIAAIPLAIAGIVRGRHPVGAVFAVFLAASLGMLGAMVAASSNRRRGVT